MRGKLFGDKDFYRRLLTVVGPILVQNVITQFVNLLDNIMVGQIGTESMSGVAIVNQLLFVFNVCVFGGMAGAGIFTAQFCGKGDAEGMRATVRVKLWIGMAAVVLFGTALSVRGEQLISLFLHEGEDALDLAATLTFGMDYLRIMVWQLIPFALAQVYASSLRESGKTVLPMKAGIIAVFVNFVLNYILIFGKLGFPALGVVGAAVATLIARIVECGIIVIWTCRHRDQAVFADGLFRTLRVPGRLLKQVAVKGTPLLANELLWSIGMTSLNQSYSVRGLEVVSATNISSTVSNLFFCFIFAMGNALGIIIGQRLGAGEMERAVDEDRKLIVSAVILAAAVGILMSLFAPLIPDIYKTTDTVKALAVSFLRISALIMPFMAFTVCSYFTLRAGGKTFITFLFDCGFIWVFSVPLAFVLSRYTRLPVVGMYFCVQALELIKCFIGWRFLKGRKWVNNLVK